MAHIYTCTMNLAIDLFIETQELKPKVVNRTLTDDIQANGKGVNVSLVLKMLGLDSTALGFSAGFTGKYIADYLNEKRINANFIDVKGMTRINVFTKVLNENTEYKLVNKGPTIGKGNIEKLLDKISMIKKGDYLCVSGSLPQGVSPNILIKISEICFAKGVNLILDTSYKEVLDCLIYKPYLLKPNEDELAQWFSKEKITPEKYVHYLKELLNSGAQNILLSLGKEGAIFINHNVYLKGNAPSGKVINTACAGDTLLGTFLASIIEGMNPSGGLRKALAAGSSTAFRVGLTDFSDVKKLEEKIIINEGE